MSTATTYTGISVSNFHSLPDAMKQTILKMGVRAFRSMMVKQARAAAVSKLISEHQAEINDCIDRQMMSAPVFVDEM